MTCTFIFTDSADSVLLLMHEKISHEKKTNRVKKKKNPNENFFY